MAYIRISAYTDRLSVKPGDELRVMASADAADGVRAELVRLGHGDEHPDGPGFVERPVGSPLLDFSFRFYFFEHGAKRYP